MVKKLKMINIAEIFEEVEKQKSKEMVIGCLQHHDNKALRQILKLNYDKTCIIKITDEELKLKKNSRPMGLGDTCLLYESKRMYVFFEEYEPRITHEKRVLFLANLLESIDMAEADIFLKAKRKELILPFITAKDINDIFKVKDLIIEPTDAEAEEAVVATEEVKTSKKRKPANRKSKKKNEPILLVESTSTSTVSADETSVTTTDTEIVNKE